MSNKTNQLILRSDLNSPEVVCISQEELDQMLQTFDLEIEEQDGLQALDYYENYPENYHPILSNGILEQIIKSYRFDCTYEVYVIWLGAV